ncbi:carboxylate-amine ligase [Candidatus Nephthysia bennettiae]|uniref:Putative glutamate--cysteine ligase 2 n=1 Tax=Candidatus Nephthysia bennettiae TaxID=3127016 RepID=A0A934KF42_9BACT|nr:carboxylate-amine ligase [Candidatus Dormibacteraeota bacterium]MBJ7612142.1 carboxylate-amine ligase [Candidatus Dormibacteraeota bacterium]
MKANCLTIAIEEEYQIVDAVGDLKAHTKTLLTEHGEPLGDAVHPDEIQSMVEAGTGVCETVEQARERVAALRAHIGGALAEAGLRMACAGTHPFSAWHEQLITDKDRDNMLEDEMQDVVRSIPIFGLHVYVAIPDWELGIEVMNESRYFLPHLLALSTSSPFWAGRDTGLKSYRSVIWSSFPRTGVPPDFVSREEYENYLEMLVKTGSVQDGKRIWWDLRPDPHSPMLEFRCCDQTTRLEETFCMAALIQAICTKLLKLRERNLGFRKYMPALIAENRWRAVRYGIDCKLIDFGKQAEVPMPDLAIELLEFIDDVVGDLGSRKAVEHVNTILREGTSADRQLNAHRDCGVLAAVVDRVCEETVAAFLPAPGEASQQRSTRCP